MPIIFDNDADYQDWVEHAIQGYVVNTTKSMPPGYMVLHVKGCPSITNYTKMAKAGGFTERDYIKVCAINKSELREWVRQHGRPDGTFSGECPICRP